MISPAFSLLERDRQRLSIFKNLKFTKNLNITEFSQNEKGNELIWRSLSSYLEKILVFTEIILIP